MVSVRRATHADMPDIYAAARSLAKSVDIAHLTTTNLYAHLTTIFAMPGVRIYLAEEDMVVGMLGVGIHPFLWNPLMMEMSELFFWVYPGSPPTAALMLLRRVFADAEKEKINLATFATMPTSSDKVASVYARFGLKPLQTMYQREF